MRKSLPEKVYQFESRVVEWIFKDQGTDEDLGKFHGRLMKLKMIIMAL